MTCGACRPPRSISLHQTVSCSYYHLGSVFLPSRLNCLRHFWWYDMCSTAVLAQFTSEPPLVHQPGPAPLLLFSAHQLTHATNAILALLTRKTVTRYDMYSTGYRCPGSVCIRTSTCASATGATSAFSHTSASSCH